MFNKLIIVFIVLFGLIGCTKEIDPVTISLGEMICSARNEKVKQYEIKMDGINVICTDLTTFSIDNINIAKAKQKLGNFKADMPK